MSKVRKEDGTWEEGKAGPKLLEPHMRDLPGEWVTEEPAEDEKIHRLDPEHVRENLLADLKKKREEELTGEKKDFDFKTFMTILHCLPTIVKPKRITRFKHSPNPQWEVDRIRTRICTVLTMQAVGAQDLDSFQTPRHVWFPEDNLNHYHLRTGNAPSNRERPYYLRKLHLEIDLLAWPKPVLDYLKRMGLDVDFTADLVGGFFNVQ